MIEEQRVFFYYLREKLQNFFIEKNVLDIVHNTFMYNTTSFLFERCTYNNLYLVNLNPYLVNINNINTAIKITDIVNDTNYDTISLVECLQYDSDFGNSLQHIYSMLNAGGLLYFTVASTNYTLENREIKYSLLNKKPCIFKDASGNISSVYDKLFGQKIDSSGNIVDSSGNILYFLGHIVDESGNKLDTTDIDLSGNVRDASGNFILCLDDVIDFSNNISDLSGSYIDSTGMVFDTSGNSFGPLNVMNQSGETVLHIFNYFNPLTTEDINNAFNLDQHFSSWQTYYNNSSCDLFFWGIKKSDDNNVITIDDLVGDNIEKITI